MTNLDIAFTSGSSLDLCDLRIKYAHNYVLEINH